jgi:ubiquitin-protein ligase
MNTGIQFVKNYFSRTWQTERIQDKWTVIPNEQELNKVLVLYNFTDENDLFKDLQLIFEITIHEEHPYKAPSIKTKTPNGRTQINQSLCIDGLTAWHPESWSVVTTMSSIIERFLSAFIDTENIEKGVGFIADLNRDAIIAFAKASKQWNWENHPDLVNEFIDQITEYVVSQNAPPVQEVQEQEQEQETEYEYSDDE